MTCRILRIHATLERTGDSRTQLYEKCTRGLFTRPVKIGTRSSGWPEHEVDAVIAARIAGKSDDDIRKIVERLTADRADVGLRERA